MQGDDDSKKRRGKVSLTRHAIARFSPLQSHHTTISSHSPAVVIIFITFVCPCRSRRHAGEQQYPKENQLPRHENHPSSVRNKTATTQGVQTMVRSSPPPLLCLQMRCMCMPLRTPDASTCTMSIVYDFVTIFHTLFPCYSAMHLRPRVPCTILGQASSEWEESPPSQHCPAFRLPTIHLLASATSRITPKLPLFPDVCHRQGHR